MPEPTESTCSQGLKRVLAFVLTLAALSAVLSLLFLPVVPLPWWKVFRRCVSVSAALSVWLFMRYLHRRPVSTLGLQGWRQGRRALVTGVLLGVGTVGVVGGLYVLLQACRVAVHPDSLRVWSRLLVYIPAMGLVAVLEELVFRGYLLQQLWACSKAFAVVGTSAAYALVHLRQLPVWPASAFELTGLFVLGVVLALATLRTGQLYLAIGLHGSLAYCAQVNKLLVEFSDPSLRWLVGTNHLVNGVGAWVGLLGIGWIVSRWVRPSRTG